MILSFDVQLQVALRALNEVVAPALGEAEKHVVEQLHLAIATISFVKTRLPDARRFARMELAGYVSLADGVIALAGRDNALPGMVTQGEAMLASAEADTDAIEAVTRSLREGVTFVASLCADPEPRRAVDRLVLDHSGALLAQYRQWSAPFGFELKPEELPAPAWL
jgi:hypothetical protein